MLLKDLLPDTISRWFVTPEEASLRLVDYLVLKNRCYSASYWRKQIDAQAVWINRGPARVATRELSAHDAILHAPFVQKSWKIVAEENGFWVLDKPAGADYSSSAAFLKRGTPLSSFPVSSFPVHRLDKMTSGLFLLAQTALCQNALELLFRRREIEKEYIAVVWGEPKRESGTIAAKIQTGPALYGGCRTRSVASHREGEEAITDWVCLGSRYGMSFLRCKPKTGRTHQIRAQLRSIGLPIVGDREYLPLKTARALRGNIFASQHLLHAYGLSFFWQGESRSWISALPEEMQKMAQLLQIEPFFETL